MILIAGGAVAAATAFPTTGSQCSWLDAIFGSLCALLGSLVLVEPFRETVPLVWMVTILLLFIGMLEIITATRSAHQRGWVARSEEHTSELQSLMRISYAVFCLKQKTTKKQTYHILQ